MAVTITDRGDQREVALPGPYRERGRRVDGPVVFTTRYGRATVERLLAVKGAEWLKDEIDRSEDPGYLGLTIAAAFRRYAPFAGRRVLDFGCGCGATAVVLGRLGADVVAVDADGPSVAAARARATAVGITARLARVGHAPRLPFPDRTFDCVLAYQVFEHIPPADRAAHARELWRVLRPGGRWLLSAPNRWWPFEFHTTRLWWIPWLPLGAAIRYAVWRGRLPAGALDDARLAEGVRGVGYDDVRAWLPAGEAVVVNDLGPADIVTWRRLSLAVPQPARRRMAKLGAYAGLRILAVAMARAGVPPAAALPYLHLVIERRG